MKRQPYLVQRLNKPIGQANPWSFGGGKINGGIDKEAMKLITKVLSFDYMGSAEFEWGAVPTALEALNNKENVIAFQLGGCNMPVYVICLSKDKEDVMTWIQNAAIGIHGQMKEYLDFKSALNKEKYVDSLGWLKIEDDRSCESPFIFFIDENMYKGMCELLNVQTNELVK